MDTYEKGAARILAGIEAVYVPAHQYQPASPEDFRHLDLKFYGSTLNELSKSGYSHLADVEDSTISSAPSVMKRIMIRSMLSADGTIMASAYDPKLKFIWWLLLWVLRKVPRPVVDFETEYADGAFLVTSNAAIAAMISSPPMVLSEYLPASTPISAVMSAHAQRMSAYTSVTGATAKVISTHAELVRSQNRMNALKAAYRKELGGISAEELETLFSGRPDIAAKVHQKVIKLRNSK
jgi:hypothetical protein